MRLIARDDPGRAAAAQRFVEGDAWAPVLALAETTWVLNRWPAWLPSTGQWLPLVNAFKKPSEWRIYDIIFEAPKFEGDKQVNQAFVAVLHDGILTHRKEIMGAWRIALWGPMRRACRRRSFGASG